MAEQTMVERVAEAIYSRFYGPQELAEPDDRFRWETAGDSAKERMRDMARAAIEAMREPTEEMVEALRKQGGIAGYEAMIDAALK